MQKWAYMVMTGILILSGCVQGNVAPTATATQDSSPTVSIRPSPTVSFSPSPTGNAITARTVVAKWKNNAKGAFTIQFDDSLTSHADIAIPELNKRNLVGTFYIAPGNSWGYGARQSVWEQTGRAGVQELANHTMTHSGATDYADAEYEIGECAKIIWSLRPAGSTQILAFAWPGGTEGWNITSTQEQELLAKYYSIPRDLKDYSSKDSITNNLQNLKNLVDSTINETGWKTMHMHGIDQGKLTTRKTDFLAFLDYVQSNVQSGGIWSAGWVQAYMYEKERDTATVRMVSATDTRIEISLTSTMNATLYNQPLTLITDVPSSWSSVRVTQGATAKSYAAQNGKLTYDAVPGNVIIVLDRQ